MAKNKKTLPRDPESSYAVREPPKRWYHESARKASFFLGSGGVAVSWAVIRGTIDADQGVVWQQAHVVPLTFLFVSGLTFLAISIYYGRDPEARKERERLEDEDRRERMRKWMQGDTYPEHPADRQ